MAKRLPDHGEIVILQTQADDMFDTDPLWIAALQSVGDVERTALALARTAQEALIRTAGSQLIPDERGNAL